jgi:MYXO-CTERM domain-containing protein
MEGCELMCGRTPPAMAKTRRTERAKEESVRARTCDDTFYRMKGHIFGFLAGLSVFATGIAAHAHVRMLEPAPRSAADGLTTGPCGNVAKNGEYTKLAPGSDLVVRFEESVAHQGCFQIAYSKDGTNNFQVLGQYDDPAGSQGTLSRTVKLPNESCRDCVVQVRQLVLNGPCLNDGGIQVPDPGGQTYYSCADICMGNTCPPPPVFDAGPGEPDATSTSSSSSGAVTSRPDSGAEERTFDDAGGVNDSCSTGGAGAGGLAALAVLALALSRRTRTRRRPGS